jgi:hypothetical protein
MKAISLFAALAVLGLALTGCSGQTLKPEESMEADLKAAGIKPGGETHAKGSTKADESQMKGQ